MESGRWACGAGSHDAKGNAEGEGSGAGEGAGLAEVQECMRNIAARGRGLLPPNAEPPLNHLLRLCRDAAGSAAEDDPVEYSSAAAEHAHKESLQRLELQTGGCSNRMLERLSLGNWKHVPLADRHLVTLLSFYQVVLKLITYNGSDIDNLTMESFRIIDQGLLFGAPLPPPHADLLHKCESIIKSNLQRIDPVNKDYKFDQSIVNESSYNYAIKTSRPIDIQTCPSLESFYGKYMQHKRPVVLRKCLSDWPALNKWKSPQYLLQKIGHRIVPIELGSKYTDSEWTQKLMSVSDFINNHILNPNSVKGYLAQHQLFNQIPELFDDFKTPNYCVLHENDTYDEEVDINAWFGPSGTISPLHTDPKHNLLSQVVGEKLVILYPPEDGSNLYCHDNNLLLNTAQVDPLNPDYNKYPNFLKAKPLYHILKKGEILYIPPKWWHYVMSLSISFSISFWWN